MFVAGRFGLQTAAGEIDSIEEGQHLMIIHTRLPVDFPSDRVTCSSDRFRT